MIKVEYVQILYVVASVLFIVGLKMLGKADTAKKGNVISAVGMLIAIIAALVTNTQISITMILAGIVLGAVVGAVASRMVAMTAMPEMVALFNGFGGLASLLVGFAEYQKYVSEKIVGDATVFSLVIITVTIFIGGVTFTGSVIAWAKLAGKITSKPVKYPGMQLVNLLLLVLIIAGTVLFGPLSGAALIDSYTLILIIVVLSLILGVAFVIPIGGGDMPVVISLLNSLSGMAACAAGFVISNSVLVVAGALVGSSGLILTNIMTKAMNRNLANVLFSGFGGVKSGRGSKTTGEAKPVSVEDAYLMLEAATSVMIVPGYGMAVAQAQHAVYELAKELEANGCEVNFAIHPVAGRMPGHMNVLLAEASVSYDQLKEMDDVNPMIENVDIAVVIGANDVVNPSAREDESSPIYGMPIINVDKARTVIVLKRSLNTGFAGIDNPLFYGDNTRMLFGDAKKSVQGLVGEFKG